MKKASSNFSLLPSLMKLLFLQCFRRPLSKRLGKTEGNRVNHCKKMVLTQGKQVEIVKFGNAGGEGALA